MIASLSLGLGAMLGAAVGSMVGRVVRWVVRRTPTKRDDVALAGVEAFLREHPEVVGLLTEAIRAALERSESGDR